MSSTKVHKCICHSTTFRTVLEQAEQQNLQSIEDLQRAEICSTKCGLCIPYLKIALDTGETEFEPGAYLMQESYS